MNIKTKYEIGQVVVVLDKETSKLKSIEIGLITASYNGKETTVSYYQKKDDGGVDLYTSYKEASCFANEQELIGYITSK